MRELHIIVDLQFGSCGKGLLAGYLAKKLRVDTAIMSWAPNAGHTFIDRHGTKFTNIALPNSIAAASLKRIMIGPGAIIDPQRLMDEISMYQAWIDGVDIIIHENAAVVTADHRADEAGHMYKIGSTMKGVGAAVIDKIRRDPDRHVIARDALTSTPLEGYVTSREQYNWILDNLAGVVLVEGAQGFSLSINQGFYPYTTSRDCTVHQILNDCAIPTNWGDIRRIYGACRTYPIRVANRFDAAGNMIGTSGPCYMDQREIRWSDLDMEPELTTVTKLPRRIFTFSEEQIKQAVRMNSVDEVFLNFVNYPEIAGNDFQRIHQAIESTGARVRWLGYGPKETDIKEILPF